MLHPHENLPKFLGWVEILMITLVSSKFLSMRNIILYRVYSTFFSPWLKIWKLLQTLFHPIVIIHYFVALLGLWYEYLPKVLKFNASNKKFLVRLFYFNWKNLILNLRFEGNLFKKVKCEICWYNFENLNQVLTYKLPRHGWFILPILKMSLSTWNILIIFHSDSKSNDK